jgi:hypothetical protein
VPRLGSLLTTRVAAGQLSIPRALPMRCAGGFVMRGTCSPQRPSIRVGGAAAKHPILYAL